MSIVIRQSQLDNSTGGDISYRNLHLFDDTLTIELTPEESFFSTEVYRGLYIQNVTRDGTSMNGDIQDISLLTVGGLAVYNLGSYTIDPKVVEPFLEEAKALFIDMIDLSEGPVVRKDDPGYDVKKLTFYDWLYDRYKRNIPPYTPSYEEISTLAATYPGMGQYRERQEFENLKAWFNTHVVVPASTRKSMFGQINAEVFVPSQRVLEPIDEEVESLSFNRRSRAIPYLNSYQSKDSGNYWGFYLKIAVDFIPDWDINSDSSILIIRWKNSLGQEFDKKIKIIIKGDAGNINKFNDKNMENLYNNYPPYFRYYEDL